MPWILVCVLQSSRCLSLMKRPILMLFKIRNCFCFYFVKYWQSEKAFEMWVVDWWRSVFCHIQNFVIWAIFIKVRTVHFEHHVKNILYRTNVNKIDSCKCRPQLDQEIWKWNMWTTVSSSLLWDYFMNFVQTTYRECPGPIICISCV
jgi:hypothetical protein